MDRDLWFSRKSICLVSKRSRQVSWSLFPFGNTSHFSYFQIFSTFHLVKNKSWKYFKVTNFSSILNFVLSYFEKSTTVWNFFCFDTLQFQCHFVSEALESTKISSYEPISSQKFENGYRTKITVKRKRKPIARSKVTRFSRSNKPCTEEAWWHGWAHMLARVGRFTAPTIPCLKQRIWGVWQLRPCLNRPFAWWRHAAFQNTLPKHSWIKLYVNIQVY